MVTSANELKLLEINTNPAMSVDNSTLNAILPELIDGTIELVLQAQVPITYGGIYFTKTLCRVPGDRYGNSQILLARRASPQPLS